MGQNWWDDDYKQSYLEEERGRQESSTIGWIYIGVDTRQNDIAKIGLTTKLLGTRASCSQNPFYALLCAFKIKDGVSPDQIHKIEGAVIALLTKNYQRINHYSSERPSEWFYANPTEMRDLVHDFLYDQFSWNMHCYYCHEREMGVIYSWEHNQLIGNGKRMPYRAVDLSNPSVAFECSSPPGCGAVCDCW
ncbi:GIY-YIG nuclease family protein [Pseudomonas brassicacearum]|uniref:GIY-YIG nuclease family protein n=1 Tax=Pseudomonas brassicacearum TaxID=930166 RepID=UPI00346659A4